MRRAFLCLSLLLLAGSVRAENRALLIGIGYYEIAGAELPGVDEDIRMMREVAETLGFESRQIKTLSHSEATLERIVEEIDTWLIRGTTSSDRAFLYHSGHGTLVRDRSGDEEDGNDEALLPYDFGGGDPRYGEGSEPRRVLLDDQLGEMLRAIPAREVVVLVDSCHSGTMTRAIRRSHKFYPYAGMPGTGASSFMDENFGRDDAIILLAAAEPDQEAQTSASGALFTQGIHQAVHRAERRRHLTLADLKREAGDYIREAVGSRTNLRHTPAFDGNPALQRLNLFLDGSAEGTKTAAMEPAETPREPQPGADLWSGLELLVRDADDALSVRTDRSAYHKGEFLDISVTALRDGYLHVLNIGDGEDELVLLYPNRHQRDNRVTSGETVRIPEPGLFRLRAHLPEGRQSQRNLLAVIHTERPLNLYENPASPEETFRILRGEEGRSTLRSFRPEPALAQPFAAGQIIVTIEEGK